MPDAPQYLDLVPLDPLPGTAPKPEAASCQFGGEFFPREDQAGGETLDDCDESRAVGFARSDEPDHGSDGIGTSSGSDYLGPIGGARQYRARPVLRWLLALLALAALLFAAVEIWVRPSAEDAVAKATTREFALDERPEVTFKGGPLVVAAASGRISEVELSGSTFRLQGYPVEQIDLTLTDVTFDPLDLIDGKGTAVAGGGTGRLVMTSEQLAEVVDSFDLPVSASLEDDRLRLELEALPAIGVDAALRVVDGEVVVTADQLELLGLGPIRLTLPALPEGVRLEDARIRDSRLVVDLAVEDLTIDIG